MKKNILLIIILLANNIYAQNIDLNIGETKAKNYFEKIDYDFFKEKIIIPVKIEGKTYRFILDSGAPTVISKEIYNLIKPKLLKSITVNDSNDKEEKLNVVLVKKLEIGNITFEQTATIVSNFNSNPLYKCLGADGFIGSNMLRNSIIQIDSNTKTLIITDNIKNLSVDKKESHKIHLTKTQSSPILWLKLKGQNKRKEQVLIDTGANGIYDISKDHYDIFKDEKIFEILAKSEGASSIGIFGEAPKSNHFKLLLPTLNINGVKLNNVIPETTNGNDSRIGASLLKYGIITIDYINKRFYFNPNTNNINTIKPFYGFSLTLKGNKLIIGFVWDKQLRNKIKYGDEVIKINNIKLSESNICEAINSIPESNVNNKITIKVKSDSGKITEIITEKILPSTLRKNNSLIH